MQIGKKKSTSVVWTKSASPISPAAPATAPKATVLWIGLRSTASRSGDRTHRRISNQQAALPCRAGRRVPFGSVRDLSKAGASDEWPIVVANNSLRWNREVNGIVDQRFDDQILIAVRLSGGVVILVDDRVRAIRHTVFLQITGLEVG